MIDELNEKRLLEIISVRTENFLRLVSNRLSTRNICRNLTYKLSIYEKDGYEYVSFEPDIFVYPDRYHKKYSDRCKVTDLIICDNYSVFINSIDVESGIKLNLGTFIPGDYRYMYSFNNKRRHWIRLK